MKFTSAAIVAALIITGTATTTTTEAAAFTTTTTKSRAHPSSALSFIPKRFVSSNTATTTNVVATRLNMSSYTVGIVGATGAVGKEIRQVLEKRNKIPISSLRIFGSERSAGKTITTEQYGPVTIELFDVAKARECDVCFLAVSGDFALEHAKAMSAGEDGCIVIDNSVRCSIYV